MTPPEPSEESLPYEVVLARSLEELRIKTEMHDGIWQISEAAWSVDLTAGHITFTSPKGIKATAPVQVVGTCNTTDGTWLWAWANPSLRPEVTEHARRVCDYGERHGIAALTTRKLDASESHCWEFAALACKLSDAQGAYRGAAGPTLVFMTFGAVKLEQ